MENRTLRFTSSCSRVLAVFIVLLASSAVQGIDNSVSHGLSVHVTDYLPSDYATDGSVCYQEYLQEAIDLAVKNQRPVLFPAMVYRLDDPKGLKIGSGLTLDLTGAKFHFHKDCAADGQAFYGENVRDVKFNGGEIVGRNDLWPDGVNIRGIYLKGECQRIRIRDMHIRDLSSNGIGIFGASDERPARDVWVTDTIVERCCNRYGDYQAPAGELRGPREGKPA